MDESFMKRALVKAEEALEAQEVPVGCVFSVDSKIIVEGRNTVNETKNPTRHAEMNCIDATIEYCKANDLDLIDTFKKVCVTVTVEPCIMCAEALFNVGVTKVVYGCVNDRFGGKTVFDVSNIHKTFYTQSSGFSADEAMNLLKKFYKGTNPAAPESKMKKKN